MSMDTSGSSEYFENSLQLALGRRLDRGIDLGHGRSRVRAPRRDHCRSAPVPARASPCHLELPGARAAPARHRLGGTRRRRNDVHGGRATPPQFLVRNVGEPLVVRVCVHGGHGATPDSELLVRHAWRPGQAIGGARRIRDDEVAFVQDVIVDPENHRLHASPSRNRQDHPPGARIEVFRSERSRETLVDLIDHVDAELAPGAVPRDLSRTASSPYARRCAAPRRRLRPACSKAWPITVSYFSR